MKFDIREAIEDDAAAITRLIHQMGYEVIEAESAKRINLYTRPSYLLLVAETDHVVVAYIALHIYHVLHLPAPEGRIISFCVDENVRGTGVGTRLLHVAEEYFKEKACYKIVLNSNLKRPETHQFYLNRGYQFTSKHFAKFLMS